MKHKTADLSGALLDAAVAAAERLPIGLDVTAGREVLASPFCFSTDWRHGGPIIERERISVQFDDETGWNGWFRPTLERGWVDNEQLGPTPLIAAMRAYVASKLGEEVELP